MSQLASKIGVKQTCAVLNIARSRVYRSHQPRPTPKPRPTPSHALSWTERQQVRTVLNSERFMDKAPRQVYATLLDEGSYLCHWRTMYRILAVHDEIRERRLIRRHPVYKKPELLATSPNEVWSWDITKLRGESKWEHYSLYTVLDIFSRYVVGWMLAEVESSDLARQLMAETAHKHGIQPNQLTLHADNGSPMKGKSLTQLLADLGVTRTHTRPHTSNDNPFSEAHFKTMKYRPDYPNRFQSIADARAWAREFFQWYNQSHYHSGLNLLTPASVHYGEANQVQQARQGVMLTAYQAHPTRFRCGIPSVKGAPVSVWINPPKTLEILS